MCIRDSYITGGVEYRNSAGTRTLGEIDLMVGLQSDCKIVHVGEVKLGKDRALRKAFSQLGRFSNFLKDQGASAIHQELKPEERKLCSELISTQ